MKNRFSVLALACMVVALAALMMVAAGCGSDIEAPEAVAEPDMEVEVAVVATDLPSAFEGVDVGVTADEVKDAANYPATIQEVDGNRVWKYFIDDGKARLFFVFDGNQGDSKLMRMYKLTP
jgi:hypothetical protein